MPWPPTATAAGNHHHEMDLWASLATCERSGGRAGVSSGIVSIFTSQGFPGGFSSGGTTCATASQTSDSVRSTTFWR